MSSTAFKPGTEELASKSVSGRLFFLDLGAGRILTANPDGSDLKTIVTEGRRLPDGIVVDVEAGHIYWTNMGSLKKTMAPSIELILMAAISPALFLPEELSPPSNSNSIRRTESSTGATAKACESCVATWMVRVSKL